MDGLNTDKFVELFDYFRYEQFKKSKNKNG